MRKTTRKMNWLRATAVVSMVAVLFSSYTLPSMSDDREDLVRKAQEAQKKRDELEILIAPLDKDLQDRIRRIQAIQEQLPEAQRVANQATATAEAAQRELQIVTDQLNVANAELKDLGDAISDLGGQSSRNDRALAMMAREMYRSGDSSSPLLLALSAESTADISQRATTAQSMARVQSRALENARGELAVTKNREARQKALRDRISGLQARAEAASIQAEASAAEANAKVAELNTLKAEESSATAALQGRIGDLEKQKQDQESLRATFNSEIAKIDEENRRRAAEEARRQREAAARAEAERVARERKAAEERQRNQPGPGPAPTPTPVPTPPPAPSVGNGGYGYPLPQRYPVTSGFGPRYIPGLAASAYYHYGIDLGAPCGTPALATAPGTVTTANWHYLAGNWVIINYGIVNGNSIQVIYMHFTKHNVRAGQRVNRGDVVGFVGTTGNSTGCHLHYEVHVNGQPVNPVPYM
ncbi:peptidoglycan DD-metalloendopeptidase family protein [Gleimia sp. 6138-11-ORH1]|uniref:M23 family metallopeptidase n=1 Tax=Gleimia sp. 6138-11-ORH1 TaxID=2973937 RepID=UPI00216A4660|nr:M23 family metallopeptidase [Gleimia sp. 6138-11-ORH1]MCS4483992.1 peptidoglycan DD-metalloendopeptidase family protein [Gleimia sp. 6138-11-ORH1]